MGQVCQADRLSFSFGGGEMRILKIVETSSNLYQRTLTTHTTLQVSQSLLDLVVTEISARVTIQSLAAAGYELPGRF